MTSDEILKYYRSTKSHRNESYEKDREEAKSVKSKILRAYWMAEQNEQDLERMSCLVLRVFKNKKNLTDLESRLVETASYKLTNWRSG